MNNKIDAIILAGGESKRFKMKNKIENKLLLKINKKCILEYSIDFFLKCKIVNQIIVASEKKIQETFAKYKKYKDVLFINGGKTRFLSLKNAVKYAKTKYIFIHDGARPLISFDLIKNLINEIPNGFSSIVPGLKLTDTIKLVNSNMTVKKTLNRSLLYRIQTPQLLKLNDLKNSINKTKKLLYFDDSQIIEQNSKLKTKIVDGNLKNIKITNYHDYLIICYFLNNSKFLF